MKVNISYAVELDEVLENVRHLLLKAEKSFAVKEEKYMHVLRSEYTDQSLGEVSATIAEYRTALLGLETQLAELNNILAGYYQYKYQPAASAPTPTPTPAPVPEKVMTEKQLDYDILDGVEED